MSRHTSTALSAVAAFTSAAALGIYSRSSRLSCGFGQAVRWPGARPSVAAPGQAKMGTNRREAYSRGAAWRSRPSSPFGLDVPAAYGPPSGEEVTPPGGKKRERMEGVRVSAVIPPRHYCKSSVWLFWSLFQIKAIFRCNKPDEIIVPLLRRLIVARNHHRCALKCMSLTKEHHLYDLKPLLSVLHALCFLNSLLNSFSLFP